MSRKIGFLIASLLMVTNALVCLAQVEQGAITGLVVDPTGASMPKSKVTATNQATGTVGHRGNHRGRILQASLPAGGKI
jgi:hypothetical protein